MMTQNPCEFYCMNGKQIRAVQPPKNMLCNRIIDLIILILLYLFIILCTHFEVTVCVHDTAFVYGSFVSSILFHLTYVGMKVAIIDFEG